MDDKTRMWLKYPNLVHWGDINCVCYKCMILDERDKRFFHKLIHQGDKCECFRCKNEDRRHSWKCINKRARDWLRYRDMGWMSRCDCLEGDWSCGLDNDQFWLVWGPWSQDFEYCEFIMDKDWVSEITKNGKDKKL